MAKTGSSILEISAQTEAGIIQNSEPFLTATEGPPFSFDQNANRNKGEALAETYQSNAPFPHIVMDNFLPQNVLRYCLAHFPVEQGALGENFDRAQERFKASYQPDTMEAGTRSLFYAFNSLPFIRFLENLTGIKGLIPDPYFMGAGFHEIGQGGHLSMHADFNHHKLMNLERRINLLIYLNDDWTAENGGQLELWDFEMKNCIRSVVPKFNRCAVFSTTSTSWHGNPQPVNHPDGKTRRSIALYYYTSTWDEAKKAKTTDFRPRMGTKDKPDWHVKSNQFYDEYLPPFMARKLKNLNHRIAAKKKTAAK
ncbi:MAG: 2OG-Fe(II) oxygenase [Parvularculaceae bacterium]